MALPADAHVEHVDHPVSEEEKAECMAEVMSQDYDAWMRFKIYEETEKTIERLRKENSEIKKALVVEKERVMRRDEKVKRMIFERDKWHEAALDAGWGASGGICPECGS